MEGVQTLEQLKAENAAEEAEIQEQPQAIEEEVTDEAAEVETEESEESAEISEPEAESETVEDWMQGDDSPADRKFTDSDIAAAKKKLKAKLERKDEENEALKAEIERLKTAKHEPKLNRPSRDDFDDDDKFFEALADWKLEQDQATRAAKVKQEQQAAKAREVQELVSKGVDQHYERAVKLSEDSGISPELYQSADLRVRQAVDSVFPSAGDAITDTLIANLGSGSEKVFYHLGVNSDRRNKLKELLSEDSSGIKAGMYLGALKAELAAPLKRKTQAPKPAAEAKGDQGTSDKFKAARKKYQSSNDPQERFNLKREAKQSGADVSNW